jgi:hypothetical protein
MPGQNFARKASAFAPGPILAFFQQWFNIFDMAHVSHPEWLPTTGAFSVALGSVSVLYVVTIWNELTQDQKRGYMKWSLVIFAASVGLCLLFRFIVLVTLFPGALSFRLVVWVWYMIFIIFGISLTHFIAAIVLYKRVGPDGVTAEKIEPALPE